MNQPDEKPNRPMRANTVSEGIATFDFYGTTLTSAQAADFLNEKAIGPQLCPVCSTENWMTVFGRGDGTFSGIPSIVSHGSDDFTVMPEGARALPVFAVACENCGYMRFHSIPFLRDWVLDREGADE